SPRAISRRRACERRVLARYLRRVHEAVPSPADAEEPGTRARDLRRASLRRTAVGGLQPPTVEPTRRACAVEMRCGGAGDAATLREMPPRVQQHVRERTSHLARRTQASVVIAAVPHRPGTPAYAVHRASQACPDALHSARERFLALRLDHPAPV